MLQYEMLQVVQNRMGLSVAVGNVTAVQNNRGLNVAVRNITGCTEQKGAECCSKKCYRLYRTEWG